MTRRAQIFFFLYVCGVLYLSLFPGDFLLHPRLNRLLWYPLVGRRQVMDAVLNVLFYVPLGVAGVWSFRRKWIGWLVSVVSGVALSALIEWLQLWAPARYGTLNDIAANSLGVALGATVAAFVNVPAFPGFPLSGRARVLLMLWLVWHAFPFVPRYDLNQLMQLLNPVPWTWDGFAEACLGAGVLGLAMKQSRWRWVAFAVIPAQMFLLDRSLSYAKLTGTVLGFAVASAFGARAGKVLMWALPVWMIFEQLRPFALREPVAFIWAPFSTWYEAGSGQFYSILFGKLFLYTATIWCLERRGLPWWQAAGVPVLILAAGEIAQKWIAGRTPESTDIVLAVVGSILLRLAAPKRLEDCQLAAERQQGKIQGL